MIDKKLLAEVQAGLDRRAYTLVAAESFTGGLLVASLIDQPGMSEHIKESFIVYSEEAKQRILGVRQSTLVTYGVVSQEVCQEMLDGLAPLGRDVRLATTGYAGPGDQAGYCFLGLALGSTSWVWAEHLPGNRQQVRQRACEKLLTALCQRL